MHDTVDIEEALDDVYILELIFRYKDGHYRYMYPYRKGYSLCPTYESLMSLAVVKSKRTKILKEFKNGYHRNLVDIKIKRVSLKIENEVEDDWPRSILAEVIND